MLETAEEIQRGVGCLAFQFLCFIFYVILIDCPVLLPFYSH